MALFDKLTGTRRPEPGVIPLPAAELRDALRALDAPDAPFALRDGTGREGADLVAVWRIPPGPWHPRRGQTSLRLVPAAREVRVLDEQWDTAESGGGLAYSRGPLRSTSKQWTLTRGPDGRRRLTESSSFSADRAKSPLREAVLAAGWTWRGVFRL